MLLVNSAPNRRFGNMAGRRIYSRLFVRYWAFVPADEQLFGFSSFNQLLFINLASVTG